HVVTRADKSASLQIRQFRYRRRVEIVDLEGADAGRSAVAAYDGRVLARRQRRIDRRLEIVRRSEIIGLDLGFLRISPVVVGDRSERAASVHLARPSSQHLGTGVPE